MVLMIGCTTHIHVVGQGGTAKAESARQWYILFGLVPLNEVKTKDMAAGAANYTIKTQATFVDGLISIVTGIVTVSCRTVEVTK
jgi:hypothetical protein